MKLIPLYFFISLLVIIPGTISLARYGLRLSIEFTGGTRLSLSDAPSKDLVLAAFKDYSPTVETSSKDLLALRLKTLSQENATKIITGLAKQSPKVKLQNFESIGPALGQETIVKTINALIIVSILLLTFISYAFKQVKFGLTAIAATIHDTLVILGTFSLLGHFLGIEVDLLFVTAVLTSLSFSTHDTIVVYDRIREILNHSAERDMDVIANRAVTETMTRSLNNSLTAIFMLLAMFLMGGDTTKYFCLALLVGTITGTYSSTFTAVPLLVVWERFKSPR